MNIYLAGIIGGLVGGSAFGMMMMKMHKLPKIAKLWGGSSSGFGFFVHLVNSTIIGILYIAGLLVLGISGFEEFGAGLVFGLIYGFIWWILGPLILMPLWLKMPIRILSAKRIKETLPGGLIGHFVYGTLLGITVAILI